ncbi:MAG: GNAT family N-acetyltransferase [Actinomycetota bacterium]
MESEIHQLEADDVCALRQLILRPHQRVSECSHPSDRVHDTLHVGATVAGHLTSIATIAREPLRQDPSGTDWRVHGMATLPEAHGLGLAGRLLDACVEHARSRGSRLVWCNARTPALGFYLRFGFEVRGDEFRLPNIGPHYVMIKDMSDGSALG